MISKIKNKLFKYKFRRYININDTVNQNILSYLYRNDNEKKLLYEYGFSVYSQHEEDGIIQYIFSLIGTTNKKCIEICIGNGVESNTANLIVNHFWSGLLFDGQAKNIEIAKKFYGSHKNTKIYPPRIVQAWIDKDNVNSLIKNNSYSGNIDFLSIDIDGNDYYIFESLSQVNPRVIVAEINHLLGYSKSVSIPYDKNFKAELTKDGSDYAGASLMAFIKLASTKGYRFVGTNRFATNAFFVRNDIVNDKLKEVNDLSQYFKHERVIYGMTERYNRIKDKEWEKK